MKEALDYTRKLLKDNRNLLDTLAHELVKRETMSKKDIETLLNLQNN